MFTALIGAVFLFWTFFSGFCTFFSVFCTLLPGFCTLFNRFCIFFRGFCTIRHFLETKPHKNSQSPSRELASVYFSKVALIKSRKSGCGRVGLETNSGWNCDATNHGWSASSMISTRRPSGLVPENTNPASSIS